MRHFVMIIISFYNMEQFRAGLFAVPILQFFLVIHPLFLGAGCAIETRNM